MEALKCRAVELASKFKVLAEEALRVKEQAGRDFATKWSEMQARTVGLIENTGRQQQTNIDGLKGCYEKRIKELEEAEDEDDNSIVNDDVSFSHVKLVDRMSPEMARMKTRKSRRQATKRSRKWLNRP